MLIAALGWAFPDLVRSLEQTTYDWRLRWQSQGPTHPGLVLIGRDAKSDEALGQGMWDRAVFARVIEGLGRAGAKVIALDFHFAGESPPERGGVESDHMLVAVTHAAGNLIYPFPVIPSSPSSRVSGSRESGLPPVLEQAMSRVALKVSAEVLQALPAVHPLNGTMPALLKEAVGLGHIGTFSDDDGVFRRVPVAVNTGGHALPAFGLAMVAAYLDVAPEDVVIIPGDKLVLRQATWPDQRVHDLAVPIDDQGRLLIHYAGRWTDGPFSYFSFKDIRDAIEEERLDELSRHVEGKMVLILHAGLASDKRQTPLEHGAPGGFVHANMVNTLIQENPFHSVSTAVASLLGMVVACAAAWLILTFQGWLGAVTVAGLAVGYVGLTFAVLTYGHVVLPLLGPVSALVLAAGGALGWTTRTATRRVERLESAVLESERELSETRRSLAHHECVAEHTLEELETLKAEAGVAAEQHQEAAQRIEALQTELTVAQTCADSARRHIRELETRLAQVTAGTVSASPPSSEEMKALQQEAEFLGLITRDVRILYVLRDLKKVARTLTPVLLLGETGTGKEVLAHAAHRLSPRASKPFLAVNVAALAPDLVESELFGHVRGAFTGADRERKGLFEQADGGTLFLDEIGELTPALQVKLLRVLQEQTFQRVGGTESVRVDVRIIAATNRELRQGVAEGWFRKDLYFRLRGIEFRLPPLRERREDIAVLADRFVQEAAAKLERPEVVLSQGALRHLARWAWPGNIRELKSCLERAVVLAEGKIITEDDLQLDRESEETWVGSGIESTQAFDVQGDTAVLLALRRHAFDMQATAQALSWDRSTVTQRLKGMCFAALVEHDGDRRAAAAALAGTQALTRVVEVKVEEYADNLMKVVARHAGTESAQAECRRRFKNLPERYLPAVETLIRRRFEGALGEANP